MIRHIDQLALEMLVGDQTLLDVARGITKALQAKSVEGGIVGGIAVFLHGYRRTTTDVDVYTMDRPALADALVAQGFVLNTEAKQFERGEFVVQLLAPGDDMPFHPTHFTEIEGIRVVSLGDLISMKLSLGTKHLRRAQDLADVVRLIETLKLDKSLTPRIARDWRKEYQKLIDAIDRDTL